MSIRSDVATSLMRPENKLEYEPSNDDTQQQEQNKTIDMSDLVENQPLIYEKTHQHESPKKLQETATKDQPIKQDEPISEQPIS